MDAEDAKRVAAVAARFLAEARRVAGVPDGQVLRLEPLLAVERAERLLGGGDEVLVVAIAGDLVELLVELLELRALRHDRLAHEEGRLHGRVLLAHEEPGPVRDDGLVEQRALAHEVVASPARNLGAALEVHDVEEGDEVVVVVQLLRLPVAFGVDAEGAFDAVVVLVVANRHALVHDVPNQVQLRVTFLLGLPDRFFEYFHILLELGYLVQELLRHVHLRLLQLSNLLADVVHLHVRAVDLAPRLAPRRVQRDHLVHELYWRVPGPLRRPYHLRIAALVRAEQVDVQHGE